MRLPLRSDYYAQVDNGDPFALAGLAGLVPVQLGKSPADPGAGDRGASAHEAA